MLKNFRKIHPIIILTTYILVSSYALPQVIVSTQDKNGASSTKNYPSGIIITSFMGNDSTIETSVLDPNENIQVIVKFREDPLILQRQRATLNSNLSLFQIQGELISEHAGFKNDLLIIETKSSPGVNRLNKSSASQIRFEYYSVFNGVSLNTKRWVAEEVKRLSYVQSVFEDKEVKAFDDISNRVIGADIVWKMKGLTGKGIKIGILDTGIDYMHPDLGGGFGPDFKVAGGYDFVNMDNDPRDDNGHGTHVAGIVSANGYSLKGVAPDSKLWAFKVLNNGGSGLTSTIIAGIERASDPDQNPKTDDGVDIINMSLGGVGDPEDPISQAVDNASLAGIVCVVAAGNNGAYQTIGSPGCARKAITVGATSNDDIITNFSSCGPANKLFNIKPDLTAPGVSIYSSINGGGYLSLDGTSMATPHVAGCAALLLQLHPDWNPELIKAVLMESAKYTGNDIWKYGTGRVDVNKAVSQNTVVTPASISLGIDDVSQQIWIKKDTISIYNYSAESELFTLNVESSLPPGIDVTFDKTSLEVAAYRSEKIIVTFRIDNNIVPYLQTNPPSYSGSISIKSQKHSLLVPFAFIKGTMLKMDFDEELWFVSICPHDKNLAAVRYLNPGKYLYLPLPKGLYTVLCVYYDAATYVIKENILIEEITSLSISRNDAKNEISFSMKNNSGQLIKDAVLANLFTHSPSGYWVSVMGSVPDKFRISDASSNILLEWVGSSTNDARNYFRTNGFTRGISKNLTFTNDPGSYRHYLAKYNTPSSIKTLSPYEGLIINYQNSKVEFFYGHNGTLLQSPFIQNIHLSPAPYKNFGFSYRKRISELNNDTPNFELNAPDTLWGYFQKEDKTPCFTTLKTDLLFNSGPPQLLSNFKNTSQNIVLKSPNISGLFFNQMKDFNYSQLDSLQYKLYTGIKFLSSGRLKDQAGATNKLEFLIPAVGQPYRLQLYGNPGCYINGRYVKATMETEFDTRKADKNPPCMKSFNIISNGLITCIPDSASGGKILFEIDDNNGTIGESGIKDVTLEYRTEAASDWLRMNLDRDNTTYTSNIPPTFDKGYVSLRFVAKDNSDNILTYTVEPAFKFGTNHLPVIHNNSEITAKVDSLLLFQVNAEDDDGDNLKYSLDVKPAWMKIDSSSGMIMGIPRAGDAGDTIAVVRVNDKNKSGVSRNFIVHVINTNHPPSAFTLMAPGDKDTLSLRNPSVPVNFRWSSSKDPDYNDSLLYSFNISGPGLDTLISKLRDTTLTVNLSGLLPKSVYTWDVTVSDGRLLTKSGRQFTFRTSDNTSDVNNMASLLPVEFELDQNYPNPFNPATTVNYSLPRSCHVIIKLFDFLGREVATLVDQVKNAGYYKTVINGDELTSGVYLYKMTAGEFMMTKKMILLK